MLSATSRSGSWKVDFVRVLISGAEYFVPKHALRRPASQAIISGNFYEPKTHELVKHITEKEEGEIIHAGTFFGDMLPSFAQACGDENLYCFEPVLENYVLARICVSKNNLQNVILFNAALSDTASNLRIQTGNSDGTQKGGASQLSEVGEIVPSVAIDQFNFKNLTCIQLYVEGLELTAFSAAKATISEHQPLGLVEDNNENCGCFLKEIGYEFWNKIPGLNVWASARRKHFLGGFSI